VLTGFHWGGLRVRGHLEDLGVVDRIILKWVLKKWDGKARTGLIWLGIATGGGLLRVVFGKENNSFGTIKMCDIKNSLSYFSKCGGFLD